MKWSSQTCISAIPRSEREILAGVSFVARPGQTVAILGTTGSGKSTLVNLVPRFYDVTGGAVKVDGHDVRDVTLASLRGQIGVVLQETLLFSGTVRENIAYGKPDATEDEVEAAARAAQADGFIRTLPQGYDTVVGERGVGLSGGQRQRIAIARALLVNPPLLILDDSTSAVDTETEALIRQALDNLMRDRSRTVLVIAQRITTVRNADLILVLDNGVIAARGTHAELLRDSPLYNDILGSQIEGGQRADLALVGGRLIRGSTTDDGTVGGGNRKGAQPAGNVAAVSGRTDAVSPATIWHPCAHRGVVSGAGAGPWLVGRAIDTDIAQRDLPGLARTMLLLLAVYLAGVAAQRTQIFQIGNIGQRVLAGLRRQLFASAAAPATAILRPQPRGRPDEPRAE